MPACQAAVQHWEPVQVCDCVGAGEHLDSCGDEQGTKRGTQEAFFKDKTLGWVTTAAQRNCSQLHGWVGGTQLPRARDEKPGEVAGAA